MGLRGLETLRLCVTVCSGSFPGRWSFLHFHRLFKGVWDPERFRDTVWGPRCTFHGNSEERMGSWLPPGHPGLW